MRIMRPILASAAFAAILASLPVSAAQSIATTKGVTVIRGVEDPADTQHGRTARERGVTVFRGNATPYEFPAPPEDELSDVQIITSGDNLWLVDPKTGDITACELTRNLYGQRTVDCTSR